MTVFREKSVFPAKQSKCHILETEFTTDGGDEARILQETVRLIQSLSPEKVDLQVPNLYFEQPSHYPHHQNHTRDLLIKGTEHERLRVW